MSSLTVPLLSLAINFLIALEFCVFLTVLFSWFAAPKNHPIVRFINSLSHPVLNLAKKITPQIGMIDLSPLVAILGIMILRRFLTSILIGM